MRQPPIWLLIATSAAVLLAGTFWLVTLQQPLIDAYEFRQTQTALSALFMQPGLGGLFEYHTPVLGAPWSIPFEFPLFQWISHHLANFIGLNLSASGRLLSVLFGLGCIWPINRLMRRAGFGVTSITILILLYFTSSIYLYWNRAFLMESTALFFTLTSLNYYSQIRLDSASTLRRLCLLSSCLTLTLAIALLVKATTALPALALMGIDWIWQTRVALRGNQQLRKQLIIVSALMLAFALLYSWTHHADAVKQLNPIGSQLTSSALRSWNFGQLHQRIQGELWNDVVLQRMLLPIAAIPIAGLVAAGVSISHGQTRTFLLASLTLGFAPLLIFSNLHIVHTYYQASNQIFLLMSVAGSAEILLNQPGCHRWTNGLVLASLTIIVTANLHSFKTTYWSASQKLNSNKLIIGELIQKTTSPNSAILVIGDDWSSAFAYHSQRRSLTLPNWPTPERTFHDAISNPEEVFGGYPLGAVISRNLINADELKPACHPIEQQKVDQWNIIICQKKSETLNGLQP